MTIRTDIHRPSAIQPTEYDWVGFSYSPRTGDVLADAQDALSERARIRQHMQCTGGRYSGHEHGGSCHVCGASAIYLVVFHHRPTNTYIQTGMDCADNMTMSYDEAAYNLFRRTMQEARERRAGKQKAIDFLTNNRLHEAWAIYQADVQKRDDYRAACDAWHAANPNPQYRSSNGGYGIDTVGAPQFTPAPYEETTITDMVGKLIKYGSISERAVDFMRKLIARIPERAQRTVQRATEAAVAQDIPADLIGKRVTIKGEVLSVQVRETDFGPTTKMLVKHVDGWKVWSTVPSAARGSLERGMQITVVGKLERSQQDAKFGFLSRPSNLEVQPN
jgi:hypothetical protein